jgi:colanic acid/amylovoran biosynthesis glycosyltransferase
MGVDLPDAAGIDFERPLSSPLRVLSVGRFTETKGLKYASRGVKACRAPVALRLIGYGELESELRREALADGANPVEFLGRMPHERVLQSMSTSDVVLLPSVVAESGDMEGIPVALMEAMARGCLVIATRHSGIPELVDSGRSGILVPEHSPGDIAEALEQIASGAHQVPALRRNARAVVERHFNGALLDREFLELTASLAAARANVAMPESQPGVLWSRS